MQTQSSHTVSVSYALPYRTIARLLISAVSGGSAIWLSKIDVEIDAAVRIYTASDRRAVIGDTGNGPWPLFALVPFVDDCGLLLWERDSSEPVRVSRAQIERGVQALAAMSPRCFADVVEGVWGDDDADVFLQLAAFGEVRYG